MAPKGYILMLEADEQDRELSSGFFDKQGISFEFIEQSQEVFTFLNSRYTLGKALPALVLLSLNSVPDSGLTVLKKLKSNGLFKHIPVIILGENTQPDLVKECYKEGASTVINKPFSDAVTEMKITSFLKYWFEVAELWDQPSKAMLRN